MIRGSSLRNIKNFFEEIPFDSGFSNIFMSDGEKCEPQLFELNSIKAKMFCLPYQSEWVFVPLLHTVYKYFQIYIMNLDIMFYL